MVIERDVVVDRYRVLSPLGRGGMAEVWLVRHEQLGTQHALKVLSVASADLRQRLLLEGRAQAALRHPNILRVSDVIDLGGPQGLVMEYVAGPSLDRWLQRGRPSIPQADGLGRGILAGVAAAHRLGVIHRDLKPGNVLLQPEHDDVVAKVADFGLAKVLGGSGGAHTRSGAAMGTPSYMAPEQIRDAKGVDERADVFALGAVLYAILAGVPAFPGQDLVALHARMSRRGYAPLLSLRPDVPTRMAVAIEAALAPDPADRPNDAGALLKLWTAAAAPLPNPWTEADRAALTELAPAGPGTPSLDAPSSSDPTWDPAAREPEVPPALVAQPPRTLRRPLVLGAAATGTVILMALASTLAPRLPPTPPLPPPAAVIEAPPATAVDAGFTRAGTPPVEANAAAIQQFHGAWLDFLDGNIADALAGAEAVAKTTPNQLPVLVLLTATRWAAGDGEGGAKAIAEAQALAGDTNGSAADAVRALAVFADGQPAMNARISRYQEKYPNDWLVSIACAFAPGNTFATVRAISLAGRISQDEGAPAGAYWARSTVLLRFAGPAAEARRAAEEGLTGHIGNPALTLALAEAALQDGDAVAARDALTPLVQAGSATPELRVWLAVATHLAGDAEGAARQWAPLVDPAQSSPRIRVMALRAQARVEAGLGHVAGAHAHLVAARDAAKDELRVLDDALDLALAANDPAIYREILTWSPDEERRLAATGHLAVLEGRAKDAAAALAGLSAMKSDRGRVARLTLATLTFAFDAPTFLAAIKEARPGCFTDIVSARANGVSGDKQTARGEYFEAMMKCGRWGPENLAGAEAALVSVEAEDEARIATNLLSVYTGRMKQPDPDLPLAIRASAARARLAK